MKQCKSYTTKNEHTTQNGAHDYPSGPTPKSGVSNDLIDMLKTSGLEDGNNQQNLTEFRFNFEISAQERSIEQTLPNGLHSDLSSTSQYNSSHLKTLKYQPSDNTFRFDFNT